MATIGKYGKVVFSDQDVQFIKDNFHKMTNDELAAALNCKKTIVRTKAYSLGLKRIEMEYWTPTQVLFLKENYQNIGDVELAEIFENEWPKNKPWTKKHIEKKRRYLGLKRSKTALQEVHLRNKISGRLAVANKKRWEITGSNPIGTILFWNTNGYQMAHIKTENGYVHYSRWLWKQHYGEVPPGFNIVRKEGCPEIPTIEFLEQISNAELAIRNKRKYSQLPQELKEIITLKNKINKTIKNNDNRNNQ
ncbi:hypothetical protein ACSV4D_09380 [Flavobacterium sp. ARAG 55.4]|uniref:hypothetical protein n=1 Tax=Flavobacterium sp. ARAG 55.4 TaxID=3451357 RepID=UPI003F44B9BE